MQQSNYIKIMFAMVTSCTIITLTILAIFLGPIQSMHGFPSSGALYDILSDDEVQEYYDEIYLLESVQAFKETYPNFRETTADGFTGFNQLEYTIQSRNENTGNILSLEVAAKFMVLSGHGLELYHTYEKQRCILSDGIYKAYTIKYSSHQYNPPELFIIESIKASKCLDDDYPPLVITQ